MNKFKFLLIMVLSLALPVVTYAEESQDENNFSQEQEQILTENRNVQSEVEADFYPYMLEVNRRIKSNWRPDDYDTTSVKVLFRIAKDGTLVSTSILKRGSSSANALAISAIKQSAPFDPLPESFKGDYVETTFDFKTRYSMVIEDITSKNNGQATTEKPIGAFLKRLYNEFLQ